MRARWLRRVSLVVVTKRGSMGMKARWSSRVSRVVTVKRRLRTSRRQCFPVECILSSSPCSSSSTSPFSSCC